MVPVKNEFLYLRSGNFTVSFQFSTINFLPKSYTWNWKELDEGCERTICNENMNSGYWMVLGTEN